MNDLKFQLPLGYYLLFLALAALLSYLLYSKEIKRKFCTKALLSLLISLRFIFLSFLFLLLFEPIIFQLIEKKEKPILIFAQDNSESILNNKDSLFIQTAFKDSVKDLLNELNNKFEIISYSFGQEAKENNIYNFNESITNSDFFFNAIKNRFYGKNLTDVVFCSDGIINNGNNPIYTSLSPEISIHAIGLGDTSIFSDFLIKVVNTNQYALLGNRFPVEIVVQAKKFQGEKAVVGLYDKENLIKEFELSVKSSNEIIKLNFDLLAKEKGIKDYSVKIKTTNKENNVFNNHKDFNVEVIDKTQNILILAEGPHPDIGVLNWAFLDQLKTTVKIQYVKDFDDDLLDFDLVVFHKGLSKNKTKKLIKSCKKSGVPILLFTGNYIDANSKNDELLQLKHNGFSGQVSINPFLNVDFNSFNLDDSWKKIINEYPPLNIPFASDYKPIGQSKIFLYQYLNGIKLDYPLVYFVQKQDYKFGVFLGEGIWRWKLSEFNKYGNSKVFKNIFQKIAQLLKVIDNKERLKISIPKQIQENQPFSINGEVYNANLELNNKEKLSFQIISENGDVFQKIMKPNDQHYELSLNTLERGSYTYSASVSIDGETLKKDGVFIVEKSHKEMLIQEANHDVLNVLTKNSNGIFIYPNQFHILKNHLLNVIKREAVSHDESTLRDLIHWKWLLLLLIIPFLEWLIRKRYGMI